MSDAEPRFQVAVRVRVYTAEAMYGVATQRIAGGRGSSQQNTAHHSLCSIQVLQDTYVKCGHVRVIDDEAFCSDTACLKLAAPLQSLNTPSARGRG